MTQFLVIVVFLALAAGFAWYLVKHDQGESEPVQALWVAFGFGALGVLAAGFVETRLLPDPTMAFQPMGTIVWVSLAIGIIEELCKCGLLVWFIYGKRYFNEHTDGVIYFALAGLGFGLPENLLYTFQFGASAGLARILMTPLFHAATTTLVGYALIKVKLDHISKRYVWIMLLTAIGLHGLYDFGLFVQSPVFMLLSIMITLGLAVGVFLLYLHARSLDQMQGLSRVGNNAFCRTCGAPNPNHKLYCSRCGNRA
jgi:RsiW-degrading membrane proteinase PrsW (M82 family)